MIRASYGPTCSRHSSVRLAAVRTAPAKTYRTLTSTLFLLVETADVPGAEEFLRGTTLARLTRGMSSVQLWIMGAPSRLLSDDRAHLGYWARDDDF